MTRDPTGNCCHASHVKCITGITGLATCVWMNAYAAFHFGTFPCVRVWMRSSGTLHRSSRRSSHWTLRRLVHKVLHFVCLLCFGAIKTLGREIGTTLFTRWECSYTETQVWGTNVSQCHLTTEGQPWDQPWGVEEWQCRDLSMSSSPHRNLWLNSLTRC